MCPFDCKASIKIRYAYLNKKVNSSPGPLRFSGAKSVQVHKGLFTWSYTALVRIKQYKRKLLHVKSRFSPKNYKYFKK